MTPEYHVRYFLNKKGVFANSQITAFRGRVPFEKPDGGIDYYTETSLMISDCSKTIRLHPVFSHPISDFSDKLRLIARVCNEFAEFLDKGGE